MKTRQKIKNKSHRHKYTKYKVYLSVIMAICIKQHRSNIGSSIRENLGSCEAELKKSVALKKVCNPFVIQKNSAYVFALNQ